jgi:hypothetical protein
MTVFAPSFGLGRRVFGAAALAFGVVGLVWHGSLALGVAAAAQIAGGVAIQFARTAKAGALVLAAVYLVFTALCVPQIVAAPRTYNTWGNFFEQFSLLTGTALVYARFASRRAPEAVGRIGRILVGVCAVSFALEQAVYLNATAALVPAWIPPSQTFWAIATTVAFLLAAVALLTGRSSLLAARLLTLMIVLFGFLVWVPAIVANPHRHGNWSEGVETFAIAGAVWILADLLGERRDAVPKHAGP